MGFFSDRYTKEGPGVEKNAKQKKGIFRYLEIFFRKLKYLFRVNMLYTILSLPAIILFFFLFDFILTNFSAIDSQYALQITSFFAISAFTFFGSGPASAGYAYVCRCFTREEHAWVWSDFFEHFKSNFKQSFLLFIINFIFVALAGFAICIYSRLLAVKGGALLLFASAMLFVFTFVIASMHMYVYQIMITFENGFLQLLKNSIVIALSQLPLNILFAVFMLVINFVVTSYFQPIIALIIYVLIFTSLVRFPMEYHAARFIEKAFIRDAEEKGEE